jgi:hypothetical protein
VRRMTKPYAFSSSSRSRALQNEVAKILLLHTLTPLAFLCEAVSDLNGRFFAGRKVRASYYDERLFEVDYPPGR